MNMDMDMDINKLDLDIEYFVNRKCTPRWNLEESIIGYHNLLSLYEGKCDFYIDGKLYQLEKGDVVYAHYGIKRMANTDKDNLMQGYALNFRIKNESHNFPLLPPHIRAGMDDELLLLFSQIDQAWLEKDEGYLLKCRALLMLVIHRLIHLHKNLGKDIKEDIRINRAKQFISEHLPENISVARLAGIAGLNRQYF